jgi:hypothetical protein
VQTVYLVKCKPEAEVMKDKYKLDYFQILSSLPGEDAVISKTAWMAKRKEANRPSEL